MNLADFVIIIILAALAAGALWYIRNKKSCQHNCQSCSKTCASKNNKDDVPEFVKAYRRDHPKQP